MEQVSGLYNPGFVGSQFHWWLGQVCDSSTWRDNQSDTSYDNPEDVPGWGYRYKVRIMGIHDAGESEIESDQLPWCQVMYSVWGGGQGGSFQTPGIKEGMFVFGFFLDGTDEQVPVIMGCLGNNAKTIIKGIGSAEGEPNTFMPKSFHKDDETTKAPDFEKIITEPRSSAASESTDCVNKNSCASVEEKKILEKKRPIECPKHGNPLTSMATHMSNFQKDYQGLMEKLNSYGPAAASKNVDEDIDKLIEKTSVLSAKSLTPNLNKTQNFLSQKLNDVTRSIDKLANITDRLDNLEANVAAQGKLGCVFNKIKGDLARLIAAGIKNSLAKKQNRTPKNLNQTRPQGGNSGLIPSIPPEGFYTPSNPCETEDLIADVFSNVMGDITQGYQEAISTLAPGSGEPTQGRLASALSQENVLANLENGKLFGGLASALGAGIGINASQSGAITTALKAGNYAAALTSLVDFSGSNAAIGGLSGALQSVANGDTIGAFRDLAGPLGLDAGIAGAIGGALGAIKGGDIASLTNALGGLGGAAPQILGDVLGARLPLSGIDIGGFGAQGGLDFDLALASTFMSTAAAFLECDPPDECPPTDTQTLSSGGESQDDSKSGKVNNTNIIEKVKATNIPSGDDLKPGSFGISPEGAQEALNNRLSSVGDKGSFDTSALTGGIIPESIEGFTERNINNLTDGDIIPKSVGNFDTSSYGSFDTSSYLPENSFKVTPKKKFNVPKIKNVGESFSEFRGRGNTRGFYNIPSYANVNEDEFIVDRDRAFRILSTIRDENVQNDRKRNFARTTNEAKYKEVYGGTGKVFEIQGKTYKPGDPGYNDAFLGK